MNEPHHSVGGGEEPPRNRAMASASALPMAQQIDFQHIIYRNGKFIYTALCNKLH